MSLGPICYPLGDCCIFVNLRIIPIEEVHMCMAPLGALVSEKGVFILHQDHENSVTLRMLPLGRICYPLGILLHSCSKNGSASLGGLTILCSVEGWSAMEKSTGMKRSGQRKKKE